MRAAYSRADGAPGAEAARSLHPDADLSEVADGVTALAAVSRGEVDAAVVAMEDSVHGLRTDVVDHLVFDEDGLFVTGVVDQQAGDPAVTTRYASGGTQVRTDA